MIGMQFSTSSYACIIHFTGGGPLDGESGLYDNDFYNLTIIANDKGIQYDYKRIGPRLFGLHKIWPTHTMKD